MRSNKTAASHQQHIEATQVEMHQGHFCTLKMVIRKKNTRELTESEASLLNYKMIPFTLNIPQRALLEIITV
jgi:hypothetical protein